MIIVDDFTMYANHNVRAHYYRVPIAELDAFRAAFAKHGIFYKIRYRGPRVGVASASWRSPAARQSTCLKQDATHFSAYIV